VTEYDFGGRDDAAVRLRRPMRWALWSEGVHLATYFGDVEAYIARI
jgi:hypothetical protein